MSTALLIYPALGAVAGVLAGLLGIGGGLVIVPMLAYVLPSQGVDSTHVMHLALGTSLASIIFTSISSLWAHHKRGAVRWDVVIKITVGIMAGTFAGACVASSLPTNVLKGIFMVFLYYVSAQMLIDKKPKPSRNIPGNLATTAVGGVIGAFSSLVGIGGGTLSVPFLVWCNVPIHHAIGTAAAIGLPIALSGAAGFLWKGMGGAGLPSYSWGYIYLPALVGMVCFSVLTAPLGARLAHSLPVSKLKKAFACLLFAVATRMLIDIM
ncbi:MAG: sulfite exporter TauE/SafE family protein [Desulfobulbaceae bacterium]|nr:sulfite exporter TauE/SafE family protein [Desulfobulbaceae bacterium]